MTSLLKVDEIQDAAGKKILQNTGSILQVVSTAKTDTTSLSSSAFTDLSGLSATITPTSSSSKILVTCMVHFTVASDNFSIAYRVLRGSTAIGVGDADGNRLRASFMDNQTGGGDHLSPSCYTFLDSPATTSATTYKIQAAIESGDNAEINRNENANNDTTDAKMARPISTITLMEISA